MGNLVRWIGIYSIIGLIIGALVFILSKIIELAIVVWLGTTILLTFNCYLNRCRNCGSVNCFKPDTSKTYESMIARQYSAPEEVGFSTIEDSHGNIYRTVKHYENRSSVNVETHYYTPTCCKFCGALEFGHQ